MDYFAIEEKALKIIEKYTGAHYPPTTLPTFEFDAEKCTHCKACAQACPTSCIQWDEEKKMPYATGYKGMELACISCNTCEAVCPANCIRVRGEYRVVYGRYKTPDDKQGEMTPPMPFGDKDLNRDFKDIEKDLTETEKVIYRRRSIRLFKDKPVPKELIHRIIEAARFAPSAGNNQPWKFVVVTNRDLIDKVDKQCAKVLDAIKWMYAGSGTWRKVAVSLTSYLQVNNMDQRPIPAIQKVHQSGGSITWGAPVLIHILKDVRGISNPDLDTGFAAHNLVLAAHSLGLGTCYIGFIASAIKYLPWLKKEIGIEYPYDLVTSVCVGYPKGKLDNPVYRGQVPVEWIE
ncbi:MAG: nitroreductase family protein [Deltaproteobacteria bacterium]|nr:nitroreductase family protein [Deltaproteobacteria bacterium]